MTRSPMLCESPKRPRARHWLWRFVGRLFCRHEWQWSHNYYGDQIIYNGWNRSAWKCTRCGAWQDRPELHNP